MRTSLFTGLMALLITCWGCERDKAMEPVTTARLQGKWRLIEPSSKAETTLNLTLLPSLATAFTAVSSFQATGQAVVNSYSTEVIIPSLADGKVSVNTIGRTKVGGSADVMQFEQAYFANLKAVNRYELTNTNQLRLYYEGVQPGTLVYEKLN